MTPEQATPFKPSTLTPLIRRIHLFLLKSISYLFAFPGAFAMKQYDVKTVQ